MQKSVLLIGMGDLTVPVLEKAHRRGLRVIATNRNPQAKTLTLADVPLVIDGADIEKLLAFTLTDPRAGNIVDVYTGTELFLTASIVAQTLGLPANSLCGAFAGQHKTVMRDMLRKAGIPITRGTVVHELRDVYGFANDVGFPVILKPADSHSTVGVRIVCHPDDLVETYKFSTAASKTEHVIIEEYIEGTLHDANGFFAGDKFYRAGIVDKWAGPPPACIVESASCPTALSEDEQEQMYELLERGARALGLSHGPVKSDVIWGKDGPRLMEVAPRFHGELGSLYLLPLALGIDMYDAYFYYLSEGVVDKSLLIPCPQGYVFVRRIQAAPGKIVRIEGLEEARQLPGIKDVLFQRKVGDHIRPLVSNYDVPGYVVVHGRIRAEVQAVLDEFDAVFHIITEVDKQ